MRSNGSKHEIMCETYYFDQKHTNYDSFTLNLVTNNKNTCELKIICYLHA